MQSREGAAGDVGKAVWRVQDPTTEAEVNQEREHPWSQQRRQRAPHRIELALQTERHVLAPRALHGECKGLRVSQPRLQIPLIPGQTNPHLEAVQDRLGSCTAPGR